MAGLPKLPGYNFKDPTQQRFHLSQTFTCVNGYNYANRNFSGPGNTELDENSVGYVKKLDPLHYDPTLTYGRCRTKPPPLFVPNFALYDKKCITFFAFFKQSVVESPLEYYRVRQVKIIYFLEDDTITIIEPRTLNAGYDQGRLVRRDKIPKNTRGDFWHWKDLNVGMDVCIYGIVYHIVDCDAFTKEYLKSQGVVLGGVERMPPDPCTQERVFNSKTHVHKTPPADDTFRRFLEYDRKILKFNALWDDRDSEYGEIRPYEILYFLANDNVAVKEVMQDNEGRDPFPLLLRKTKLPKIWTQRPIDYPSIYLELTDAEVTEYYQPKDFRIGETIFVLGRRMLIYDCDNFTRNYFKKMLNYEQPPAIDIKPKPKPEIKRQMPPHIGIGTLEDSLQSTLRMIPTPPRKDVIKQITNANKYLRYEMKFDAVHPEDTIRRFVMNYSLGDGTVKIMEPRITNSGILGGMYLSSRMLVKPGSDPLNPDYYTPMDFYIGAVISVFEQRFIITGADLYVYRYMQENPEKFTCEVIENMRNYMYNQGLLADDLQEQVDENLEAEKKATRDAIGRDLERTTTEMEKCLEAVKIGGDDYDPEYEKRKKAEIVAEYEESMKHTSNVPPYGIKPVNTECRYPVRIGDVKPTDCSDMPDYSEFTPKHIDTPEEAMQKHYDEILRRHKAVCMQNIEPPCQVPRPIGINQNEPEERVEERSPIMVQPVELPKGACRIKQVKFADDLDKCSRDRFDLCDAKTDKIPCDCTNYYQKC